jgi:magnesium-transporting ATPase (P-type)
MKVMVKGISTHLWLKEKARQVTRPVRQWAWQVVAEKSRVVVGALAKSAESLEILVSGGPRRAVGVVGDRALVQYRGVAREHLPRFQSAAQELARDYGEIIDVRVNPYLGRVVLRFSGKPFDAEALCDFVLRAEQEVAAGPQGECEDFGRVLPDDPQLDLRFGVEAVASALSMMSATVMSFAPAVPRVIGDQLYSLSFVAAYAPSIRRRVDERLGHERADLLFHLAFCVSQALAQRPLGAGVDLLEKAESFFEVRRRRHLWNTWAPELMGVEEEIDLVDLPPSDARSLPQGTIERHAARALYLAAGIAAFSLITTANPARAVAAGLSALPRSARLGRELFCIEVGRVLAKLGVLVLAPQALRRLDRINCLIVADSLFAKDQFSVQEVFACRDIPYADAVDEVARLFDAEHPLRVQHSQDFVLGPLPLLRRSTIAPQRKAHEERAARGGLVLGLADHRKVIALVEIGYSASKNNAAVALDAARASGLHVVIATDDPDSAHDLSPDDTIGLRNGLVEGIVDLQRQGRTVCFLGSGPSQGYGLADLGVAVHLSGQAAPWNAHLVCPAGTRITELLVEICVAARFVSRRSAIVATATAGVGGLAATTGSSLSVPSRVAAVINSANMLVMLDALRHTLKIHRRPRTFSDPTPWHALDPKGVLALLGSSEQGLPAPSVFSRARGARRFSFKGGPIVPLMRAVGAELSNPLTPLLALGAGVSAVVESKADAAIVGGVALINGLIGGSQRFKTERAISRLLRRSEATNTVLRQGQPTVCLTSELRPGDVILLAQGDTVPADCRVLESFSLEVYTAALTGESLPVSKSPEPSFAENTSDVSSMLFSQNAIAAGRAKAVVVAVGDETVAARARTLSLGTVKRGGVEERLEQLMHMTGPFAMVAGAALMVTGLFRGRRIEELVNTGVGLAVAAVPEGLPMLATAAQLSAAERLSRKGALVRNPRALESLGRVDRLCMDKTGTLSQGRVALVRVFDGKTSRELEELSPSHRDVLRYGSLSVTTEDGIFVDPMDEAVVRAAAGRLGEDPPSIFERFAERAFESKRGYQAVAGMFDGAASVFVKGAPELVLEKCIQSRWTRGKKMTSATRKGLYRELEVLSSEGLRVIAVAKREIAVESPDDSDRDQATAVLDDLNQLTFCGFLAFEDPLRSGSDAVLADLARAGVQVVMVTGDHPNTAASVARKCGLLGPMGDARVLRGEEIARLSDRELQAVVDQIAIFARVTPAQKVRIVRALQQNGHVVGMVGDGVNDAAAMRVADAGIAVGRESSEAARTSADIVLYDPRLGQILETVVEGRAMWTSVRHAVSILLGGNLGEIAFTVAVGALTGASPLSPRQFLVVNFLTDIAPSMVIALQPPDVSDFASLREATPENVLGTLLNREIAVRALCTSLGAGVAWTTARLTGGATRARTVALAGLVGSQLGQTLRTGTRNTAVRWTCVGSAAALFGIIQTPGLSQLFGCTPLGPVGWTTALVASAGATLLYPVIEVAVDAATQVIFSQTSLSEGRVLIPSLLPVRSGG